ncbi:hypothetical protein FRC04_005426 [Tulasnella sp. 424]|nr:hypothetical protein FRC04_005426 [Tulasnella sp. 424]
MPVPKSHYRVALGDYDDDDSWIIQSKKGLIWMNIPDALSSLLNRVPEEDILDFSLGSEGRFYIRYMDDGQEKRKLSKYLWEEMGQDHTVELDRLTLGPDGQYWGVRVDRDGFSRTFEQVDDSGAFGDRLVSKIDGIDYFGEIEFVALGANGDWAFGVNGRVECRGSNLLRKRITEGRKGGKTILSAAMSPRDRLWFLCWDDGTIDYWLPGDMTDSIDSYCQLRYSLMSKKSRAKKAQTEYAVSARELASVNSSTSLRLLDNRYDKEEFSRIHKLFKRGWKHDHKALPDIQRIFAVTLPDPLEHSYLAYKADDYTNDLSNSSNRVVVVARVVLGKSKVLRRNTESLRSPPSGYDSVLGEVGIDLNYDEQILYRDDAIRPAYVVIYEP